MIRTAKLIFCDNEHGSGDMCYPDIYGETHHETLQHFIEPATAKILRKAAKQDGWSVLNGADYCPGCTESMTSETEYEQ
jgi:hypothetical protein